MLDTHVADDLCSTWINMWGGVWFRYGKARVSHWMRLNSWNRDFSATWEMSTNFLFNRLFSLRNQTRMNFDPEIDVRCILSPVPIRFFWLYGRLTCCPFKHTSHCTLKKHTNERLHKTCRHVYPRKKKCCKADHFFFCTVGQAGWLWMRTTASENTVTARKNFPFRVLSKKKIQFWVWS